MIAMSSAPSRAQATPYSGASFQSGLAPRQLDWRSDTHDGAIDTIWTVEKVETSHDPATDAIDSLGVLRRGTTLRAGALREWQPSLSH